MAERHPTYPSRDTVAVTVRGQVMPGWFSGPAVVWTGGAQPIIIGPFPSAQEALEYQTEHAPGANVFPIEAPSYIEVVRGESAIHQEA